MKKVVFLVFALSVLQSCTKDKIHLPTITGYELRDETNNLLGEVGEPNINKRLFIGEADICELRTYPIPASDLLHINFLGTINVINKLTIVKVNYDPNSTLSDDVLSSSQFGTGLQVVYEENNATHAYLEADDFEPGYYRVYFETDGHLLWNNFKIEAGVE